MNKDKKMANKKGKKAVTKCRTANKVVAIPDLVPLEPEAMREMARQFATMSLNLLAEQIMNPKTAPIIRQQAALWILTRAYGAPQKTERDGFEATDIRPGKQSQEKRDAIIRMTEEVKKMRGDNDTDIKND